MMSNIDDIIELQGKRLVGILDLNDMKNGIDYNLNADFDNAILLIIGTADDPEYYALHSVNQDYSMYDKWTISTIKKPTMDMSKYKSIGEVILAVENKADIIEDWWSETDQYWLFIKTVTKEIRLGHHWYDCHYPASIWEVLE